MVTRIGPKNPVHHFLRQWRKHRGLSQQQLADRVETSKDQISSWETGRRGMSSEVREALAQALGIQPADIFRDPEAPSVDELLRNQPDDVKRRVVEMVRVLLKTGT